MASTTDLMSLRAVRQLRRIRAFYAVGALLWAASTAWTAWHSPGSRQMWVSALLLVIFTGLLAAAALWLQRCQAAARPAPCIMRRRRRRADRATRTPDPEARESAEGAGVRPGRAGADTSICWSR